MRELSIAETELVGGSGWVESLIGGGLAFTSGLGGGVTAAGYAAAGTMAAAALPAVLGIAGLVGGGYLIYSGIQEYRAEQLALIQMCAQ